MSINLARKDWYDFWQRIRKAGFASLMGFSHLNGPYAYKLAILETIHECEKDGWVRISDRFMDCDHAISTGTRLVPNVLVHVMRYLDNIFNNAEGPGNAWIHSPEDEVEPDHRDLILEAFEDGHPHVVSEVRFETH